MGRQHNVASPFSGWEPVRCVAGRLAQLGDLIDWMAKYSEIGKREMDFADATLVWLADETNTTDIMTVDMADFSRYRLPDGRGFNLLQITHTTNKKGIPETRGCLS
jgi:hypothetical protein